MTRKANRPQTIFEEEDFLSCKKAEQLMECGLQPDQQIRRLEQKLRQTQEKLDAATAQLASAKEQLKTSNEKYWSAKKELESFKEEPRSAIKELVASEERFRLMAQSVPALLFMATADLDFDYVNRRFTDYTGLPDAQALGNGWITALHKEETEANREEWLYATGVGRPFEQDVRLKEEDGDYRWFTMRAEPFKDRSGAVARWFGCFIDIHERRLAEDRQKLLARELQHRVRNILSVVRTVTRRTAESSESIEDFVAHFDGRMEALARTQNVLTRTPQGGVDLRELVTEEVLAQATQDDSRLEITGPTVRLKQQGAEILGLAVHELATNAFKYGAFSKITGQLSVSWQTKTDENGRKLIIKWCETGVPIPEKPERRGFGREILERGLVYELSAKTSLEFTADGLRCVIELPLPEEYASLL